MQGKRPETFSFLGFTHYGWPEDGDPLTAVKRRRMSSTRPLLLTVHRWLGVSLCLFFCAWFISGAVMIYVPFPSLSHETALAHVRAVAVGQIEVSPHLATEAAGTRAIDRLRLTSVDREAVYLVHPLDAPVIAVRARDGHIVERVDARTAQAVAEHFARHPIREVEGPLADDQWIVASEFDPFRPFYRVSVDDADRSVLYVSARTGEVLQQTTRQQRAWNYAGAVVHWIYPTIVRQHWVLWDQLVWWLSFAGIVVAVIGLWLGLTHLGGRPRSGRWKLSPYRGWQKWHHILGLFTGLLVLTWIFSGWLSMDQGHNRLISPPDPAEARVRDFRGISLKQAVSQIAGGELNTLGSFAEAEFNVVGGVLFVTARAGQMQRLYMLRDAHLMETREVPQPLIRAAVRAGWPDGGILTIEHLTPDDAYGRLRHGALPISAVRVVLNDEAHTWIHIDVASGAILGVMDRSRRVYRWLFNGLHSFDFPGLASHRPLWDIVMLLALLAGFSFTVTAVIIGLKRTRAKLKGSHLIMARRA